MRQLRKLISTISIACSIGGAGSAHAQDEEGSTPEAPSAEAAAPCSGREGRLRGTSRQSVRAGGLDRTFIYHAPTGLDPDEPTPLVIVPHGYKMNARQMYDITRYTELADREGFAVAFPNAVPDVNRAPWNVGMGVCGNGAFVTGENDDQAFVDAIIDFADQDRCIDREHVFMNGFSMGGYLSNDAACINPNIKGIAPHSGGTHKLDGCLVRKVPVLILHFNSDTLISYHCGLNARNEWIERNGCTSSRPEVELVWGGHCEYYRNCTEGGQVAMCTFREPLGGGGEWLLGHGWAGGAKTGRPGDRFSIAGRASATELSWKFFKKYAW